MRITRETLIRVAKETAIKRSYSDKGLVAVFLTGSVLTEDPFLGGSTDIDLVFVHAEPQKVRREILPLTPDVHLDVIHACRDEYKNPKELRVHPTLGPEMYNPLWLYETQHFLEFVQAAVRTKYHDPGNVLERSRRNSQAARQGWMEMQATPADGAEATLKYLDTVALAANAVAVLNGAPLAERRFMLEFPKRAVAAGCPELAASLEGLLGAASLDSTSLGDSLPAWEKDFNNASDRAHVEASIAAPRLTYYRSGITALLKSEMPQAALWPLVHTWTLASQSLPPGRQGKWQAFCEALELTAPGLQTRLEDLDHFLDKVEELLDGMAARHGI